MIKIWKLLKQHVASDFQVPLYLTMAIFLGVSIAVNYAINLENGIIDKDTGKPIRIVWYFLLYGFAYFGGAWITFYFNRQLRYFKSGRFWIQSVIGIAIISVSVGWPYMLPMVRWITKDYAVMIWLYTIGNNVINFFIAAIPIFILARIIESKRENFGVTQHNVDLSPYWQLLLIIIPIIIIGSFEDGFRNYYPTYKANAAAEKLGWPAFVPAVLYELAYGLDFFNVELMFRGMLIIGMSQLIGKEAILPMVCAYCYLHFGKPVGESISSVIGGYILGVVAFYTRNIWGGVIVHMGLAWMMEIAAYLQKILR